MIQSTSPSIRKSGFHSVLHLVTADIRPNTVSGASFPAHPYPILGHTEGRTKANPTQPGTFEAQQHPTTRNEQLVKGSAAAGCTKMLDYYILTRIP